jgi:protein-tyrosine phosphatase
MGAVHGVYLKYVGLSALSYAGYSYLMSSNGITDRMSGERQLSAANATMSMPLLRLIPALVLGYSAIINGAIAILFKLESGMFLLGKDRKTGQIPLWSYILFFPFHGPNLLYTYLHTLYGSQKIKTNSGKIEKQIVPVASEVQPGWWVGGCYGYQLNKDWGGVIDLTVEFPELCIHRTQAYLSIPTWDGVPATPAQLEEAANFAVEAHKNGDVLVHCAHGRGRSTTILCACLVKTGQFGDWQEALEKGIQPGRPVCKLNKRMRQVLAEWQAEYVDGKKVH